jgi:pimeloyl-ACP methyl ester carboxylesterase
MEMLKRTARIVITVAGICLAARTLTLAQSDSTTPAPAQPQTGYASVNGLNMYYEIHGTNTGTPLVVLHGAYMSIASFGEIIPRLAETRQVIAVELQGHGRTNDIPDRQITYEHMADDVAAFMGEIGVDKADVLGYSMGASTALQVAIRHPERVNRLVFLSSTYNSAGWHQQLHDMIATITPEMFAGSPMEAEYLRLAPNPEHWPLLVSKLVALDRAVQDWPAEDIQGVQSPTLVMVGDSDQVRLEHAVELFKLLGGGVPGDLVGMPQSQLAIIPAASHVSLLYRVDLLNTFIVEFLDAPAPSEPQTAQ